MNYNKKMYGCLYDDRMKYDTMKVIKYKNR